MASNKFNRNRVEKATWRYGTFLGATANHALGKWIPSGAIVTRITTVGAATGLSGATGGTVAFYLGSTCMLTGAAATTYTASRVKNCFGLAATGITRDAVKLSADSEVKMNASKNLVKGAIDVYVEYYVP